jgi:hypothetical protein
MTCNHFSFVRCLRGCRTGRKWSRSRGCSALGNQHRREQFRQLVRRQEGSRRDGVNDRAEAAGTGAGVGAGLGGAAGLLAGLGLLAIPGLGPVVAAGWLAATAVGATAGAHRRTGRSIDRSWRVKGRGAGIC